MSYDYSYDNNGNITEIKQNGKLTNKYVYDSLNELKEEYDYVNKFYINYSYDGAGNLQNKYEQVLDDNGNKQYNFTNPVSRDFNPLAIPLMDVNRSKFFVNQTVRAYNHFP